MPSPLFSIWLKLLSPFFTASLPLFFHDWENETFCVKCGLNADHFISLVRMRTKSAIADFYGSSDNVVKRFYEILLKIRPCFSFAWIQFLEKKKFKKWGSLIKKLGNFQSTYAILYQLGSTWVNMGKLVSTWVKLYQLESTYVNFVIASIKVCSCKLCQLGSTWVNLAQFILTWVHLVQFVSICVNLCQVGSTWLNLC